MDEPKGLTAKQIKGLEALLDGANIQDAASAAGVNRKTIGRWLNDPAFWNSPRVVLRASWTWRWTC